MENLKKSIPLLLFLFSLPVFSFNPDSLFIAHVKKYAFKEFGTELKGDFYTKWKENESPDYLLFVSLADTIQSIPNYGNLLRGYPFENYVNEFEANEAVSGWKSKGYHTFIYRPPANSNTKLTRRFLSYSNEGKCFIIFHELLHNYILLNKIKIPYEFHEALCDVVGNYGTLKYSTVTLKTDPETTNMQIELNEKIYECFNRYILKTTKSCPDIPGQNSECNKEIHLLLKSADIFQKDRFDYEVNNAFLLKNMNYCRNYFLLKRVLLKQGSILKVLEIIKTLPENPKDCVKYLEKFATEA